MATSAAPAAGERPAPPPAARPDVAELESRTYALMIVGVMAASLLQILDTTIANVALPHMRTALGASPDTITWVLTSYIVATAIALPATGWLSERLGSRNLFLIAVAGFIVAEMRPTVSCMRVRS